MKKYEINSGSNLYELIVPFGEGINGMDSHGLFDDCPICRKLKQQIEKGEVVPLSVEEDGKNVGDDE